MNLLKKASRFQEIKRQRTKQGIFRKKKKPKPGEQLGLQEGKGQCNLIVKALTAMHQT